MNSGGTTDLSDMAVAPCRRGCYVASATTGEQSNDHYLPVRQREHREHREIASLEETTRDANNLNGAFSRRVAFPNRVNGIVTLTANMRGVRPDWNVFVAMSEAEVLGDAPAGPRFGSARFTVNNVAPLFDKIVVRGTIEWDSPLAVIMDFLIVPAQ
jgi:hypothetical protein